MGTSKHRKAHKTKSAARSSAILQRRQHAMDLIEELQKQLDIVRANPITGVDIQNTDMLTITGTQNKNTL
jgi:hypothetical protein